MSTPLNIDPLPGPAAGVKAVAAIYLPTGLTVPVGTTLSGGTVSGAVSGGSIEGASVLYLGLVESPPERYGVTGADANGTVLPAGGPYKMEVRQVDPATVMTVYTNLGPAFAGATDPDASLADRQNYEDSGGAFLSDGVWGIAPFPLPTTPSGVGAYVRTVTVTDEATTDPIVGATVRLTSSTSGLAWTATTGVSGVASFSLNAGTYTLSISADGYSYTPTTVVVTGAGDTPVTLTALPSLPLPSDPGQTTAFIYTRDTAGSLLGGVVIEFQLVTPPTADSWSRKSFTATSNDSGLLQVSLAKGATYRARRTQGLNSGWYEFTTGTADTFPLPQILSPQTT